jgi:lysozyme family protein
MAQFKPAFAITSKNEGWLSNVTADRGGLTWAGIAENYWPNWKGWPIIKSAIDNHQIAALKTNPDLAALVESFYLSNFWNPLNLSLINDQQLANAVYDMGVNAGTGISGRLLQQAIAKTGILISIDGRIGPATLQAANEKPAADILTAFNQLRHDYYQHIVDRTPSQKQFLADWLSRIRPYVHDAA